MVQAITSGLHVLIANADWAEGVAHLLRLQGHRVEIAATVSAALELAQADPPDVLLLDSGLEIASRLCHPGCDKQPFIIRIEGWTPDFDRRHPELTGVDLSMAEPVSLNVLGAVLRRFQDVIS